MLDYETLRLIWWALLGVLLIGFAVMDGFDLGAAILLPFVAKTDGERRIVINSVGPVWEGNQVWFILGGGAIFAAWPTLYAVAFSGFYLAMFLVLCALIARPVAFKFRSKVAHPTWRAIWDRALFAGGLVPALIFGVAFGNVIQGVPFRLDETLRMTYESTFLGLLNPFALLCGLVSVTMLVMHGGTYLALKTSDPVASRAAAFARYAAIAMIALFVLGGVWLAFGIDGYSVIGTIAHDGPSNPMMKEVTRSLGSWMANYQLYPWTIVAPILAIAAGGATIALLRTRFAGSAFITSALSVASVIATAGLSIFPFLLPSSIEPKASLTVWDASSSRLTLMLMLSATALLLPIVIAYTAWVYRILRGRVTLAYVTENASSTY